MDFEKIPYMKYMVISKDVDAMLEIENQSFENPWTKGDFVDTLHDLQIMGLCMYLGNTLVGYMVYRLDENNLHLLKIAVHPQYRRQGYGSTLINRLKMRLSNQRSKLTTEVDEFNLPALCMFRKNDILWVDTLKDFFAGQTVDTYQMEYVLAPKKHNPKNRIAKMVN